jgi:hypothetical protein
MIVVFLTFGRLRNNGLGRRTTREWKKQDKRGDGVGWGRSKEGEMGDVGHGQRAGISGYG